MANATESPGTFASILGAAAYQFSLIQPHLPVYTHMVISSILPIYAGAHASLSRPSSAAKRTATIMNTETEDDGDEEEDEEEEEEEIKMEGLSPSDALMFPIMAAITLTALYVLIKWLNDPAILNKVLGWYFAGFGMLGATRLLSDLFTFMHSLLLPARYVDRRVLWKLNFREKKAVPVGVKPANVKAAEVFVKDCEIAFNLITAKLKQESDPTEQKDAERQLDECIAQLQKAREALEAERRLQPKLSPLPGPLSRLKLASWINTTLWAVADIPRHKIILKINLKQKTVLSTPVTVFNSFSLIAAVVVTIYFNTIDKPWYLTNLLGFSFSYGALQMMSPTTFATGALLLSALFFYDIYMVFFTPMMVTVAKSLDIPIKLVFPRPTGGPRAMAMVGLGDIVLPGIMIGLALRFDLFLHYLRQQTPTRARNDEGVVKTEMKKATWRPVSGRWADAQWIESTKTVAGLKPSSTVFAKPYFRASLIGYVIGLVVTIIAMHLSGHGQPALLYLVPGVLGSLLVTALWRKESKIMWEFTEAMEEEAETSLAQKGKELTGKVEEVKKTGLFSKAFGSSPSPNIELKAPEKGKGSPDTLKHARDNRSGSFSSSWGSAASSEPDSPLAEEPKPFKPAPIRSPLMLRSSKNEKSVHGDSNTFFSITLSLPTKKGGLENINWKETAKGDELLAPSGKRQRTAL